MAKRDEDITKRFEALGFATTPSQHEAERRLLKTMGCISQWIAWMHSKKIQHGDLKPPNILVRPGEIYITNFGISRDRSQVHHTTTDFHVGDTYGYSAPEITGQESYNPEEADIYSLGCVILHILTVVYELNKLAKSSGAQMLGPHWQRKQLFREHQLKTGSSNHPKLPWELVELMLPMFADERKKRPTAQGVDIICESFTIKTGSSTEIVPGMRAVFERLGDA